MANKKKTVKTDRIASHKTTFDKRMFGKQHGSDFKREDEKWENIVEMFTQVKDIDDEQGMVYLNCKYEKSSDETFERAFPLKHFKNKEKLVRYAHN